MYVNLAACDGETLEGGGMKKGWIRPGSARPSRRRGGAMSMTAPWVGTFGMGRAPSYIRNRMRPSLYGLRNLPALGEYEDENLGKFKLKKITKSVTKAVTKAVKQTAKVAVKPAALVVGSSLQAVGLRKLAASTGKSLGLTEAERRLTKYGGVAIQAAAITAGAVVAAPYAGAIVSKAGIMAAAKGKALMALAPKAMALFQKVKGSQAGGESDTAAYAGETGADAAQAYGLTTSAAQAPTADLPLPFQQPSYGDGSSGGAAGGSGSPEPSAENPLQASAAGLFGDPKMLLIAAGGSFLIYALSKKGGKRR